jgi:methylglutaconyl-CoA hydratase
MSQTLVLYENLAPAAVLTINRPDSRNALSQPLIAALAEAFRRAEADSEARCVILTGAGTVFCAGMDLAELKDTLQKPEEVGTIWDSAFKLATLFDQIYALTKPTIAAVNGAAVAGGCGLVTVCDLAVAATEARLGYPEVRRGLVAAMVMPHLLRHVGERLARYLLLTGDLISAEEASKWGLINQVVTAAQLMESALAWARSLAEGGPNALTITKTLLRQFSRQAMSVEDAAKASAAPRLTEECQQGLRAFFAKEPAPWSCERP